MRKKHELSLEELEAKVARRAERARLVVYSVIGAGAFLILLNAVAGPADPQAPLVQRWWAMIPAVTLALLAGVLAVQAFWLLPRELAVRKWQVAARPLYGALLEARAAEERLLDESEAALVSGQEEMASLLEEPTEGTEAEEFQRRAARLDAYRVALNTLEIDALLKKDFVGSAAANQALEKAVELLSEPREKVAVISAFRSIAVLPFVDLSPLRDQEYFSHGLAEELINILSKLRDLRVVARGLAFSFSGQDLSIGEIGRRLGVDSVVDGSVQKAQDRLRVTARLVSMADGRELWSGDFDEESKDVFKIEDRLANGVLKGLELTPTPEERRAIAKPATRVAGAYDYYLRGRKFFAQFRSRGMEFAYEMFSHAIELDDQFALAHAGIADCCSFLYANAGRLREHQMHALEASARALELDPELAEAHLSRAVALSHSERLEEAAKSFNTALRLNPKLFEAHYFYARHHFACGHPQKAIQFYESAAALRPEEYQIPLLSAQIYDDLGRHEEAAGHRRRGIKVAEEHLRLNPDDARALYMGANGLVSLGRMDEGLKWARRARELEPLEPLLLYNVACIYSLAGEVDEAIDCLETGVQQGFSYREWAEHDSNLDNIRDHPGYLELMEKM